MSIVLSYEIEYLNMDSEFIYGWIFYGFQLLLWRQPVCPWRSDAVRFQSWSHREMARWRRADFPAGSTWITRPGKHTKNYGKIHHFYGENLLWTAIFNSYVKLPEGNMAWLSWVCLRWFFVFPMDNPPEMGNRWSEYSIFFGGPLI
jgi:hypothetical protein